MELAQRFACNGLYCFAVTAPTFARVVPVAVAIGTSKLLESTVSYRTTIVTNVRFVSRACVIVADICKFALAGRDCAISSFQLIQRHTHTHTLEIDING